MRTRFAIVHFTPKGWRPTRFDTRRESAEREARSLTSRAEYGRNALRPENVRVIEFEADTMEEASRAADAVCASLRGPGGFHTELTPEGEQYVVPGCERRVDPKKPEQGTLW